jgi:ABC-type transport system involved in cytochrome c biogenesis permease subunit
MAWLYVILSITILLLVENVRPFRIMAEPILVGWVLFSVFLFYCITLQQGVPTGDT